MKIEMKCLIDNLRLFGKQGERRLRVYEWFGVGEAVPDQRRAYSLNTGWVKVPVKFSALAVVSSEQGCGQCRVTHARVLVFRREMMREACPNESIVRGDRERRERHCMNFSLLYGHQKRQNSPGMNHWPTATATLLILLATFVQAEDFKTVSGKVYKDATVSSVEADGIVLKTKAGVSKVYFTELPPDVQERFHWAKPEPPREPFYSHWAASAEDPAVLAKIIAAAAAIMASVGLIINHIRSRRQPTIQATRASRRKALHYGRK